MKFSRSFIHFMILLTIPALVAYPQAEASQAFTLSEEISSHTVENQPDKLVLFSYDDVLELLEELEEGELEKRCSQEDLEQINQFIALLATNGLIADGPEEERLDEDIQCLLSQPSSYRYASSSNTHSLHIVPAVLKEQRDIALCKGFLAKKWDQTKRFVRKHKKEVIIGTAIVVAVVVVIVVTAGSAAPAAAAASAGALKGLGSSSEGESTANASQEMDPPMIPNSPALQKEIEEKIVLFKEGIIEAESRASSEATKTRSLGEMSRELGSCLAHDVLDAVSQSILVVPYAMEELQEMGRGVVPRLSSNENAFQPSPVEKVEALIARGHEKIDRAFSTQQAARYSSENRANENALLVRKEIGFIPPPTALGGGAAARGAGRLSLTEASSTRGWAVGDPINNRTAFGTIPRWSTVRSRYWKNEAMKHRKNEILEPRIYKATEENLARMDKGLAPRVLNKETKQLESIELHHIPSQKEGGVFDFIEVTPEQHAAIDGSRRVGTR